MSNQIAKNLGANVINCGFGGTRATKRNSVNGYDAFDFSKLIDAIISKNFSYQDSSLVNISTDYYAERLNRLKTIDLSHTDILTINFGTNDWTGGVQLENNSNLYDITYYKGALRYCIQKILTEYPAIKIVLITPTWRMWFNTDGTFNYDSNAATMGGGQNLPLFVKAMKDVAEEFQLPVIDAYYLLGVNKFNYTNYFNSPDGTHHSENGRISLGRLLSQQLQRFL